eukprot:425076_1
MQLNGNSGIQLILTQHRSHAALFAMKQPRTPGIHSQKQQSITMVTPAADSIQNKQGDKEAQEDCVGSSNSEDKVKQNDIENFRLMRFAMKSGSRPFPTNCPVSCQQPAGQTSPTNGFDVVQTSNGSRPFTINFPVSWP